MFRKLGWKRLLLTGLTTVLVAAAAGCGPTGGGGAPQPPKITPDRVGFSTGGDLLWESDADLAADLDALAATGAKWLRIDVDWKSIQAYGSNDFRWQYTDRVVNAALAHGLQVLGTLAYSPPWAQGASCRGSIYCPPANPNDYARFAAAAAQRYAPLGVHAWEIWNEPNWYPWWVGAPDATAYVALLKPAYVAIHQADPNAVVVSGGLAPHGNLANTPNDPISPVNYLKAMYAAGAKGYFDAFGVHPYPPLPHDPLSGSISWNPIFQTTLEHQTMVANGDGAKPIWGTETGGPTGGTDAKVISPDTQARYINETYTYWVGQTFTGPLFIHNLRDEGYSNPANPSAYMGVLYQDRTPKPAVSTMQAMITP
jgi:hypothetical protein